MALRLVDKVKAYSLSGQSGETRYVVDAMHFRADLLLNTLNDVQA